MKSPFTGKEMSIQRELRTMNFRKDEFEVLYHFYKCDETGEQFEDEKFAQLNYNQLANKYRERYSIPFPEQIIDIRLKYDVSASRMSEILGFGANSYRQYESGEIPNQSNARLIQVADDPHEFGKLVNLCSTLESKTKEKIINRVKALIEEQRNTKLEKQLAKYFFDTKLPNIYTGYKVPNLEKFTEMVIFFTEKMQPWKTKLNKLLFYADFSMFREYGYSISGIQYKAIPLGPVPNKFDSIFDYLVNNNEVEINYTSFSNGGIGEQFKPLSNRQFKSDIFSTEELDLLEKIAERYKNMSTKDIIEYSHKEKAWIENLNNKKFIDYQYSFELN